MNELHKELLKIRQDMDMSETGFQKELENIIGIYADTTEKIAHYLDIDVERCMEKFDQYIQSDTLKESQRRVFIEGIREKQNGSQPNQIPTTGDQGIDQAD